MYANVIIQYGNKAVDREFTYIIPISFRDKIKVGHRVRVLFNNREIEGFVLEIFDRYDGKYELNEIISLVDSEPILNDEMLYLGREICNKTLCSKISAYQVMLPKALKASESTNIGVKKNRYIVLNVSLEKLDDYISKCRYPKQIDLLNQLKDKERILFSSKFSGVDTLFKNGIIRYEYEESYRYNVNASGRYKVVNLNEDQLNVVNSVDLFKHDTYLLYGVTGSGKTEVYMELIDKVLKNGKDAIMLVPEISLTPQIVDRFVTRFGDNVAILHSGLSDTERYDEYRKIMDGRVKIVVGARSAIFAPFKNLGIVIIDEEHTSTYKQENHPRYNAKDVAMMRGKYNNIPVLLGSATPSLESFARASKDVYKLLLLTKRAGNGKLPKVHVVDMKNEIKKGNFILSKVLIDNINDRLVKGEQVILLLNRRGYSSMLTCRDCGSVLKCPNCDISLTYHKTSNSNRCHYCNYSIKNIRECLQCGSSNMKDYGLGTEKLEEELNKLFDARIVRMDMDTTSKKGMHEKIVNDFGEHKYDILVGTQMIAKGLDYPLVTLVGVINADSSLNVPDFRSSENTFQLLSQVSGRAGRSEITGEVVIQTYNPEHYSIRYAKEHDYLGFYKEEMSIRRELCYSPYFYITLVNISSRDYDIGFREANKIGDYLRKNLSNDTKVLGPSMANIFRINNVYYYQCIIKYKKDDKLNKVLREIDDIYKINTLVDVCVDVDPVRI
ncbi:MAG: primosomal protein N' [Bacilli bacterium]|nr:primosomal protein N' [Bacilli bacterium]